MSSNYPRRPWNGKRRLPRTNAQLSTPSTTLSSIPRRPRLTILLEKLRGKRRPSQPRDHSPEQIVEARWIAPELFMDRDDK